MIESDVFFISTLFHPYGNNSHLCQALVYNKTLNSERTSVLRSYTTRSIHTKHRELVREQLLPVSMMKMHLQTPKLSNHYIVSPNMNLLKS